MTRDRAVVTQSASRWRHAYPAVIADISLQQDLLNAPAAAVEQLQTALHEAGFTRQRITVIIADDLVRYFMVKPPKNASSLSDCQTAVQLRFQTLYGESAASWQIRADWHARHPFFSCALSADLIAALHDMTLVQVVPYFIDAWNRWRSAMVPGAWFGVMQNGTLMLGLTDRRRLCDIHAVRLPIDLESDFSWIPGILAREALRLDRPMPERLHLTGDHFDESMTQCIGPLTIDWFIDPGRPPRRSGYAANPSMSVAGKTA